MPLQPICFPIPWCEACKGHARITHGQGDGLEYVELHPFLSSQSNSCRKKSRQHSPCAFCIELEFGSDSAGLKTWEGWIVAQTLPAAAGILKHRKKLKGGFKILSFSVSFICDITYIIYIIYMIKQQYFLLLIPCPSTNLSKKY